MLLISTADASHRRLILSLLLLRRFLLSVLFLLGLIVQLVYVFLSVAGKDFPLLIFLWLDDNSCFHYLIVDLNFQMWLEAIIEDIKFVYVSVNESLLKFALNTC